MKATPPRAILFVGITAAALTASIVMRAQQPPGGGPPAAKPLVPMTASSLALNPDPYVGETVSMTATVEQVLSKTAFSVDQDKTKSTGKEVLVLAPALNAEPALNVYVSVVGEVVKFDPAEIEKKARNYRIDLPAEVIEKFRGKPAVIATSVIMPDLTDLTKRPMTPDEVALSRIMKSVQPTSGALRQSVDASDVAQTKQNTATLKKNFSDVQAFFQSRGTADAIGWATDALKYLNAVDTAVAAGKWEDAKSASASLSQLCTPCHAAHREPYPDGTYRIKG